MFFLVWMESADGILVGRVAVVEMRQRHLYGGIHAFGDVHDSLLEARIIGRTIAAQGRVRGHVAQIGRVLSHRQSVVEGVRVEVACQGPANLRGEGHESFFRRQERRKYRRVRAHERVALVRGPHVDVVLLVVLDHFSQIAVVLDSTRHFKEFSGRTVFLNKKKH